ncbi:hypothetical protein N0V90_008050 [Kalmusia sp. IMI 367209]|nr:hypothetical protein N0V90_008050 [Kalmusia sp. IMI 367209]
MATGLATTLLHTPSSSFRSSQTFPMILKTPTPQEETLCLSALDQNTVRVYTQVFLIFPFPDKNQAGIAIQALQRGLHATLGSFPFLAGNLSLADDESGKLVLTYPTEVPDLKQSGLFASNFKSSFEAYEKLKKEGMPPSAFPGSKFRPDDFANYPGIPSDGEGIVDFSNGNQAPAMRVQADFIPGGLVLSTYVHHAVMDCKGINIFWKCFAGNISDTMPEDRVMSMPGRKWFPFASQHWLTLAAPDYVLNQLTMRQRVNERAPTFARGQVPPAEAYVDGAFKYQKHLPDDTQCSLKYFLISAARIRGYRDHLKQYFPDTSPPTICNVLAALLWIHVTRARAFRRGNCGHEMTNIGIATDLRTRMDPPPPLEDTYTGNMAIFSKGTLRVQDIIADNVVTEKTIVHTIKEVRDTISKVDNEWVSRHLGFFKAIDKITDTECGLAFRFGMDIYITSWMNFGADLQWGIPGTDLNAESLGGRPEFIRRSYGPSDGGMMIMPRRRHTANGEEAPYEVMVRLATVDMERLLAEEGGDCPLGLNALSSELSSGTTAATGRQRNEDHVVAWHGAPWPICIHKVWSSAPVYVLGLGTNISFGKRLGI